jgi:hypothetical protein
MKELRKDCSTLSISRDRCRFASVRWFEDLDSVGGINTEFAINLLDPIAPVLTFDQLSCCSTFQMRTAQSKLPECLIMQELGKNFGQQGIRCFAGANSSSKKVTSTQASLTRNLSRSCAPGDDEVGHRQDDSGHVLPSSLP